MLSILASITIIIARIRAITEFDIKKIIALSTLSQLGLIITSLSLGQTNLTFFHLLTHAIFKALLFICAGNLILQFSHSQDLRQFGNNLVNLPITTAAIIISKIALCGIPFIAGFYSKDIIIEFTFQSNFNLLITIIILLGLMTTIIYSIRFIIFIIATPSFHSSSISTTNLDSNLNLPITIITLYVIP
jgi:NADH-ubiquinone oxidoreductase chain 5